MSKPCAKCAHDWVYHTKGDFGPCDTEGCDCPHFYHTAPNAETENPLEQFQYELSVLANSLQSFATNALGELLRGQKVRVFYVGDDYYTPPMDGEKPDLTKVRWNVEIDGRLSAVDLSGDRMVMAWVSGARAGLRHAQRSRPARAVSLDGKSLVQEAMILLTIPPEARDSREERWKTQADEFIAAFAQEVAPPEAVAGETWGSALDLGETHTGHCSVCDEEFTEKELNEHGGTCESCCDECSPEEEPNVVCEDCGFEGTPSDVENHDCDDGEGMGLCENCEEDVPIGDLEEHGGLAYCKSCLPKVLEAEDKGLAPDTPCAHCGHSLSIHPGGVEGSCYYEIEPEEPGQDMEKCSCPGFLEPSD